MRENKGYKDQFTPWMENTCVILDTPLESDEVAKALVHYEYENDMTI